MSDAVRKLFVPSAVLAEIVGARPRSRAGFLEAVMDYVKREGLHQPPPLLRTDARLRRALADQPSFTAAELPELIGAQLTKAPEEDVPLPSADPGASEEVTRLRKLWEASAAKKTPLEPWPAASLKGVELDATSLALLLELGLPETALPFVTFTPPWQGALPRVSDNSSDGGFEQKGLEQFRVLGADGQGNPICIDEEQNGAVVMLDQRYEYEAIPVNAGLPELIECLAAYADWRASVTAELGEAIWDKGVPDAQLEQADRLFERIDSDTYRPNSFWYGEVRAES